MRWIFLPLSKILYPCQIFVSDFALIFSHLLSQFSQLLCWKQWFNIQSVRSFSKSYNIWSLMWFQVLSLIFQIRFEILSILLNFRLLPKCFHIGCSWRRSDIYFPLISNQEVASTSFLEMPTLVPEIKIPLKMEVKPRYKLLVHCLYCFHCFHRPHCFYYLGCLILLKH